MPGPEEFLRKGNIASHLGELRRRLTFCLLGFGLASLAAYPLAPQIYALLVHPLARVLGEDRRMIYTGLTEAFTTYIKLSLFAGAFVSLPWILYQVWAFVAPGLYKKEKSAFRPFLIATPLLFFAGAAFVYFGVIPLAWAFFAGFETPAGAAALPIRLEARVSEYLDLIMQFMLAFGLCFQLPVLMSLLGRAGFITARQVGERRRLAAVVALIVAAIFTPPDVLSQLMLGIPLIVLYEASYWLLRWSEKR